MAGVMTATAAAERCVETILSGPAGGVVAGESIAGRRGCKNLITADMGGTSLDVAVIHQGRGATARDAEMAGLAPGAAADEDVDPGWPWSFLLLVAAGAIYLIFRFVELGIKLLS